LSANTICRAYEKKGVYPKHDIDLTTPNEHELDAIYTAAQERNYFERHDWWTVIDALGISSTGVAIQLRELTTVELVDEGVPQRMVQLLPFIPNIITKLGDRGKQLIRAMERHADKLKGVVMAKLLPPSHPLLQSPAGAPYILTRNMNESPDVGGVYLRHFPAAATVNIEDVVSVNGVGDTFLGVIVAGLAKGLQLDENLIRVAQKASVMTLKSKEAVSPDLAGLSAELGA
jgi:pseudouridylate synthase / pseudouridine kinase